jgi:ATP-dependent DNA helicase RecQ
MSERLSESLRAYFGFDSFRPGQLEAIESLLDGQHVLVVMPTGSRKSLIYQLVALLLSGQTLVISPLIALMKDQVDALTQRGIPATYVNSTLSSAEQARRLKAIARGDYRLVYVTPERLRSAPFREALGQMKVSLLAVDEAHCISYWGHDFRPDYLHIADVRAQLGAVRTVALTATATPRVQAEIIERLTLSPTRRIITGFNRPNLTFSVYYSVDFTLALV